MGREVKQSTSIRLRASDREGMSDAGVKAQEVIDTFCQIGGFVGFEEAWRKVREVKVKAELESVMGGRVIKGKVSK